MTAPKHPARYSRQLVPVLAEALRGVAGVVLDPFAGTGERLAELAELVPTATFVGVEIEPKWAAVTPSLVRVGNALALDLDDGSIDAIVTSPAYGNRMADHHEARDASERNTYRHRLGEPLQADNAGALQWGDAYREFHKRAWAEAVRVLRPGGRFVLNVSDHVRKGRRQPVSGWHVAELCRQGLEVADVVSVATRRLRHGANGEARVDAELVITFTAPEVRR